MCSDPHLFWVINLLAPGRWRSQELLVKFLSGERHKTTLAIRDRFVYAANQWETTLQCNVISHSDIGKSTGPRSSTSENSGGPMKTIVVPVLLSSKKNPVGSPSMGTLMLKKMRSCKSFWGPVKLGFSMWLSVLCSGKGPKVFPMSDIGWAHSQGDPWVIKSMSVQVMAWCHQVASHYLSQRWPISMLSYGATNPQWVTSLQR